MHFKRALFLVVSLSFTVVGGCQSVRPGEPVKGAHYSETHIPFAAWKRKQDCCTAVGREVAIASGGTFASKVGVEIWKKGGNIVDAAAAVAFVLAVERPHSAGIGGGGFLLYHSIEANDAAFMDFRETAPHRASKDMYLDAKGQVIPGKSVDGALSVATPGFVWGWYEAHRKWGDLPWKEVLAPAIRLARQGFPVYPSLAEKIAKDRERLTRSPYVKKLLFKANGEPLQVGDTLKQTDLASTLETIARGGAKAFYEGPLAKKITAYIRGQKGILDGTDLDHYTVKMREPVRGRWGEHEVVSAPPPSAGGVLMVQMLNVLDGFDLAGEAGSPAGYAHLLSQVMKRAYADRSLYIGDPDFVEPRYRLLMSREYADKARKKVDRGRNTPSKEMAPGEHVAKQHGTTQLSLIDSQGNALTSTITINGSWGSGLAVPGTGIFLNNEMDDFSIKPGEGNLYGLTGGDANAIAPSKRPVSSMMPTILLKQGRPVMAVGGAGGSRIISSVFQVVLNQLVVFPGDLRRSLFAPRVHHQWLPDRIDLEEGYPDSVKETLKSKGHEVAPPAWAAQVQAVRRNPDDNTLMAVFDPRDEGGAAAE